MSKVCVPGGQVPLRTLVRVSGLQIFTIIDDFARLEPPHGRAQPELNPHALPFRLSAAEYLVQSSATDLFDGPPPLAEYPQNSAPESAPNRATGEGYRICLMTARCASSTRKPVEQVVHLDTYGNRAWLDT